MSEREQVEALFGAVGRFSVSSFYTNRLPLLNLPGELLEAVRRGDLHYSKARELGKIKDVKVRSALLWRVFEEDLSLADIRKTLREEKTNRPERDLPVSLTRLRRSLTAKRLEDLSDTNREEAIKLIERLEKLLQKREQS